MATHRHYDTPVVADLATLRAHYETLLEQARRRLARGDQRAAQLVVQIEHELAYIERRLGKVKPVK